MSDAFQNLPPTTTTKNPFKSTRSNRALPSRSEREESARKCQKLIRNSDPRAREPVPGSGRPRIRRYWKSAYFSFLLFCLVLPLPKLVLGLVLEVNNIKATKKSHFEAKRGVRIRCCGGKRIPNEPEIPLCYPPDEEDDEDDGDRWGPDHFSSGSLCPVW